MHRLIESSFPNLPVLAYHELVADLDAQSAGVLTLSGKLGAAPAPVLAAAG
jgi:type III secretory pathway component EscV